MSIKYTPDYLTITTTDDDGIETIESAAVYSVDTAADLDELFAMFGIDVDDDGIE